MLLGNLRIHLLSCNPLDVYVFKHLFQAKVYLKGIDGVCYGSSPGLQSEPQIITLVCCLIDVVKEIRSSYRLASNCLFIYNPVKEVREGVFKSHYV